MKGFEVKVKNDTVRVATNADTVISIIVQKHDNKLSVSIGGLSNDTMLHYLWYFTNDLKLDDEVIIEKKEFEQSSEPIEIYPALKLSVEEKKKLLQQKLQRFRFLEIQLKDKNLL
jgi:hypothetical protein